MGAGKCLNHGRVVLSAQVECVARLEHLNVNLVSTSVFVGVGVGGRGGYKLCEF